MLAKKPKQTSQKEKTNKDIERMFKGIANHRRIAIIKLIDQNPGITLEGISEMLSCNIKTISGHTYRLVNSGLINKSYQGHSVVHNLSPYGKKIIKILKNF